MRILGTLGTLGTLIATKVSEILRIQILRMSRMSRLSQLVVLVLVLSNLLIVSEAEAKDGRYELKGPKYPLVLQTFLDSVDVSQAFNNKHYLTFLFKCVFFEGHCDIIGKWLKPRAMSALFGECLACTKYQSEQLEHWLELLGTKSPMLFRAGMVKLCYDLELPLTQKDLNLIQPYLKV